MSQDEAAELTRIFREFLRFILELGENLNSTHFEILRENLYADVVSQVIRQTTQTNQEGDSESAENFLHQHVTASKSARQMIFELFAL